MPMGLGLGMPLTRRVALGAAELVNLFAAGEDGFLFGNWSELDELFTTSLGVTAVAADSDPVGLALDDHAWGSRTLAQQLAQATELLVAGSWSMGTAPGTGTATESPSGQLNLTGDGTNQSRGDQSFATVVGRTYRVAGTVAGNTVAAFVGTTQGGSGIANQTWAAGASYVFYFVATSTTTWVRILRSGLGTAVVTALSCKEVSGNHALQATSTQRPLYKVNSGKPYLSFDGSDDKLVTPFIPPAAVTLAVAVRIAWTSGFSNEPAIGGGQSVGNHRCYLGGVSIDGGATVQTIVGWGAEGSNIGGPELKNTDRVLLLTGDAVSRDVWVDGALISSAAPSGGSGPDGTGGGIALAAYNNNNAGGNIMSGRIYAALAINRRVTPSEIALITNRFQRTYQ